ncbi:MAG: T9SS type A sorting domain-containing protein [Bacteroidota bacterium]
MKTLTLILSFCLLGISLQAQDFFQIGDQWTYRDFQFAPPFLEGPYSYQLNVVGDTNIQGLEAVILQKNDLLASQVILRSDNQKVWIWRDSTFQLFVDFTLQAGDTLEYHVPYEQHYYEISCGSPPAQNDVFQAVIDSVSYINLNGFSLKQLHTSNVWDTLLFTNWILGTITEGIGSDQGFWGRSEVQCLAGYWGNFACYTDLQRGIYVADSLACHQDTNTLAYPNFMLETSFQWHEITLDVNGGNREDYFFTVGESVEIDGESWRPVCELSTNQINSVAREFFLRHDSLGRQLFYRHSLDSAARLLYDFNIGLGSVLDPDLYGVNVEPNTYVSGVDTLYVNGRPIRYFELNDNPWGAGIYEGFGSSKGLFFGTGSCLCYDNVHSMQLNGQTLFALPSDTMPQNCESFLVSNEAELSDAFAISQMGSMIEIRTAAQNAQSYQVELLNLQAQSITQKTAPPHQIFRLSTQAFPAGVYLLQIRQGQAVLNRKILVGD